MRATPCSQGSGGGLDKLPGDRVGGGAEGGHQFLLLEALTGEHLASLCLHQELVGSPTLILLKLHRFSVFLSSWLD